MDTIIFVGLVVSGLLFFLILSSSQNTKQDEKDDQLLSAAKKVRPFFNMRMELKIADNGGTRSGIDRRKFHYTAYAPEKRSGIDRRKGFDRRRLLDRDIRADYGNSLNQRKPYRSERRDIFRI